MRVDVMKTAINRCLVKNMAVVPYTMTSFALLW